MKEQTRRSKRMASLIRERIARTLLEDVHDPRLASVGVTEVMLTNDLRQARVFYETHGNVKDVHLGLKRAMPFIRRQVGSSLEMKYVPELVFELDTRSLELSRLMSVMDSLGGPSARNG